MISFGSLCSSTIATILLSIYGYVFISLSRRSVFRDLRILIVLLFIAALRMLLPVNLPLNFTIPFQGPLAEWSLLAYKKVFGLELYQCIFTLILSIATVILVIKGIRYHRFRSNIRILTVPSKDLTERLQRMGASESIKVVHIQANMSPFVFGLRCPIIVIPAGIYSEDEIDLILKHELTHIRQHDLYYKFAMEILSALFWWNPLIWLIRKQIDSAIEISNDITLYTGMSELERLDFASLLVKTSGSAFPRQQAYALSLAMHAQPLIRRRVTDLIQPGRARKSLFIVHLCLLLVITAASFLVTPEPYMINPENTKGTFTVGEEKTIAKDSYILDHGDYYELFLNGKSMGTFHQITEDFRRYPIKKAPK